MHNEGKSTFRKEVIILIQANYETEEDIIIRNNLRWKVRVCKMRGKFFLVYYIRSGKEVTSMSKMRKAFSGKNSVCVLHHFSSSIS